MPDIFHDLLAKLGGVSPRHVTEFDRYRGSVISAWAGIESTLDKANHYAWVYTRKAVTEKVPVSLGRKIELFKEINRDLAPFEPLRETAAKLMERVNRLIDVRHWMAHGYIIPKECTGGTWLLNKHEFPKGSGGLNTLERRFTVSELDALRKELVDLMLDFAAYGSALANQVDKHAPDNHSR